MEKYKLINNTGESRYEYRIEDYTPHIEYKISNGVIALTHTRVPLALQGKGVGKSLVEDTLKDIDEEGLKLLPLCGFVASYIRKNPEWKRLLTENIYIG